VAFHIPDHLERHQKERRVQVLVRDNNVDQALKALKKKMQREGIFREMKLRGHYEKPSEKKAREKAEAVRRARKLARKRAQREGLIPVKAKPAFGAQGGPGSPAGGRGGPARGGAGRSAGFGAGGFGGGAGFVR
jgi:small subunit ribosomal protein S21